MSGAELRPSQQDGDDGSSTVPETLTAGKPNEPGTPAILDRVDEEPIVEVLGDDGPPDVGSGLWQVPLAKSHMDVVRQHIAYIVVFGLVGLYAMVILGALVAGLEAERVTALVAALGGPSSLAAAVIGFYFGQGSGEASKSG